MPILHSLPPVEDRSNRLLAGYHDGLRGHLRASDRALARGLGLLGLGGGWSPAERRLLARDVRAAGVSMAKRRGIHRLLNPAGYPLEHNLLRDKARFARHVADHLLPAPASFDPDRGPLEAWLDGLGAVIAKPGFSSKGQGIEAFHRKGARWSGPAGERSTAELARHLGGVLQRHGVVQQWLAPDPDLADLSPGALPTLRVVTGRNADGAPECGAVVLRLGLGNEQPVDNFNAGGIAVRVGPDGLCSTAFRSAGSGANGISEHPRTGAAIAGRPVPMLKAAIALGERAHATLPEGYAMVGWDIGLSACGAVLIEGNWNPGTDIVQLVEGQGLDRIPLGALYRLNLERVPVELWRQVRPVEW